MIKPSPPHDAGSEGYKRLIVELLAVRAWLVTLINEYKLTFNELNSHVYVCNSFESNKSLNNEITQGYSLEQILCQH